jgi:hypothetical protein
MKFFPMRKKSVRNHFYPRYCKKKDLLYINSSVCDLTHISRNVILYIVVMWLASVYCLF